MRNLTPSRLQKGDTIRVVALSLSMSRLRKHQVEIADKRFSDMGFNLTFGEHVNEVNDFRSLSITSRIEDLHGAFRDKNVKAIIAVIGGWSANQLLSYIDWDLIRKNPKIFCGYSDITVLNNAIFAKTGLITYSGPSYSRFGEKLYFDFTMEHFLQCLTTSEPFLINPSEKWSDDEWHLDQEKRSLIKNDGYLVIQEGSAKGTILGGNLDTFNLIQGTEFFPDLTDSILFLEDDSTVQPYIFDRDLQSLLHQPSFKGVKGIIIGRFQQQSKMTNDLLRQIIKTKKELQNIPIIANVDLGHTDPMITFPIGGKVRIKATKNPHIEILEH